MFIIGFCHAESITVLFYGIAVGICGVSVEGNQGVRIRAFFWRIYQTYNILIRGAHGLQPAFFIYYRRFCYHTPWNSFQIWSFYSGRYDRTGKEKKKDRKQHEKWIIKIVVFKRFHLTPPERYYFQYTMREKTGQCSERRFCKNKKLEERTDMR